MGLKYRMTVGELKKALKHVENERVIIMAGDSEGNNYSPLSSFWLGAYSPDTTWSGEVGLEKLSEEDIAEGYTEDDVIEGGVAAVIFSPIN